MTSKKILTVTQNNNYYSIFEFFVNTGEGRLVKRINKSDYGKIIDLCVDENQSQHENIYMLYVDTDLYYYILNIRIGDGKELWKAQLFQDSILVEDTGELQFQTGILRKYKNSFLFLLRNEDNGAEEFFLYKESEVQKIKISTEKNPVFQNTVFNSIVTSPFPREIPDLSFSSITKTNGFSGIPYILPIPVDIEEVDNFNLTSKDVGNGIMVNYLPEDSSPLKNRIESDILKDKLFSLGLSSSSLFKSIYIDSEGNTRIVDDNLDTGAIEIDSNNQFVSNPPVNLDEFLFNSATSSYDSSYTVFIYSGVLGGYGFFQDDPPSQPKFSGVEGENPKFFLTESYNFGFKFDGIDDFLYLVLPDELNEKIRVFTSFESDLNQTSVQPILDSGNIELNISGSESSKKYSVVFTDSSDGTEDQSIVHDVTGMSDLQTLSIQLDQKNSRINLSETSFNSSFYSFSNNMILESPVLIGKNKDGDYYSGVIYELAIGEYSSDTSVQEEISLIELNHQFLTQS